MINPTRLVTGSKIVLKSGTTRTLISFATLMPGDLEGYAFINNQFYVTTKFYPTINELLEAVPAAKEALGKEYIPEN